MSGFDEETARTLIKGLELARSGRRHLFLLAGILGNEPVIELCKKIREFDRRTP
jgi:hypothetical protein